MQGAARALETFPALADTAFEAHTGITRQTVRRHFGTWEQACQLAGLQPRRMSTAEVPLEELFRNLQTVEAALGRSPRQQDMHDRQRSRYTAYPYLKRFDHKWNNVD
jgi:hypothetical protein